MRYCTIVSFVIAVFSMCSFSAPAGQIAIKNGDFEKSVQTKKMAGKSEYSQLFDFYGWTIADGKLRGGLKKGIAAEPNCSQHVWAELSKSGRGKSFTLSQNIGAASAATRYMLSFDSAMEQGQEVEFTAKVFLNWAEVVSFSQTTSSVSGWKKSESPSYIASAADTGKMITIEIAAENKGKADCNIAIDNIVMTAAQQMVVDGAIEGRIFEGVGALSAGASTRLLIDYPEPYRSQILDLLFKPNFGASLHQLKVEVGSGMNSTDGTEPSHANTREELEQPKKEYYDRGYEWWLMKEAKKRNPDIMLDILPWGAPAWIGNGNFYTQDMADYMTAFITGAKQYHGLTIDFAGIWNEMPYDVNYIKLLRRTFDAKGYENVKIIAADVWKWSIMPDMLKDKDLDKCVFAAGNHYSVTHSTHAARNWGKPLWASEDGPWSGRWDAKGDLSPKMGELYNRNYINGRMTKTIIWALITSYYSNLPFGGGAGLMRADAPWSGAFEIEPALWMTAHTTQFAKPGWKYLDGAGCGLLWAGGSYVTLKSPESNDYSIIIETQEANSPQLLTFDLKGGLSALPLHVWRSDKNEQFVQIADITPTSGRFSINVDGDSMYSLTTTKGQSKGAYQSPAKSEFPTSYSENFETYTVGATPKYFSDQSGTFEVVRNSNGDGKVLRQVVMKNGLEWNAHKNPYPETFLGDTNWKNYEVSVKAMVEQAGFVSLYGRVVKVPQSAAQPDAYCLRVSDNGAWELRTAKAAISSGHVAFSANTWHVLKLKFDDDSIEAYIDGVRVTQVADGAYGAGMAGVGCGWHAAQFDDFSIQVKPALPNLALNGKASASSQWDVSCGGDKINDGRQATRWNAANGKSADEWVEIDFGKPTTFNKTVLHQYQERITSYKIQYWDGVSWADAYSGGAMSLFQKDMFKAVTASKIRLYVVQTGGATPTLCEFEVYNISSNEQ